MKRLKRKTEEIQSKLTSLNGSDYITVNWDGGDPPGFARVGGEGSVGLQMMPDTVGVDSIHNHSDGAFVVATVAGDSPGMGSLFDNGENGICQSGFSIAYTTGLVDWDNAVVSTTDHTHLTIGNGTVGTVYNDNYIGDGHFTLEVPGMMPNGKPKVPCAVCGENLHIPENFPEDFPEDFKLCCGCQEQLSYLPGLIKKFQTFIGKREVKEWAESE